MKVAAGETRRPREGPWLSRRALLASSAAGALLALAPTVRGQAPPSRGEPFADGMFFDDGFGWVEGPARGRPLSPVVTPPVAWPLPPLAQPGGDAAAERRWQEVLAPFALSLP